MKSAPIYFLPFFFGPLLVGCSDSTSEDSQASDDSQIEEEPAIDVPSFVSGLDEERMLSSLVDDEISAACDRLLSVVSTADTELACRVVAAGESRDQGTCVRSVSSCLSEPEAALNKTTLRSTPGAIECEKFTGELVAGCEFPVSLLEDCVNALAQGVVPGAEALSCGQAEKFEDLSAAEQAASENRDTTYTETCFELLECKALVDALLGGK